MKRILLAAALAAATLCADAQPYGPGGPGMDPMGPRFNAETTPGWMMMTPEERKAHQEKMHAFKDAGECQVYMEDHRKRMESRAAEQKKVLPGRGPGPGCDYLKKKS